jgi:hypothetical protein
MGLRERKGLLMETITTPYALGSEDGEALWFFGML